MVRVQGTTIEMTRGDTLRVYLTLKDCNGDDYTPDPGDSIRFAMKKRYNDASPIIMKNIPTDTLVLELEPAETKTLQFAEYVYDIEMTYANGDVDTFIDRAKFKITEEVH